MTDHDEMGNEELNDRLAYGDPNDPMLSDTRKGAKNEMMRRLAAYQRVVEAAKELRGWTADLAYGKEVKQKFDSAVAAITWKKEVR